MNVEKIKETALEGFLPKNFNKAKFALSYSTPKNALTKYIQGLSKAQCLGKSEWPKIEKIDAWMLTAETATFMKIGGLGMIASELPEAFNHEYGENKEKITVVTPMYVGSTGKKTASLDGHIYKGCEGKELKVRLIKTIDVSFICNNLKLSSHQVAIYKGEFDDTDYIFLSNNNFFSINPGEENGPSQQGCYVLNEFGINEVERFAFFSKAIYILLKSAILGKVEAVSPPNVVVANDWHSGALAGLTKYMSAAQGYKEELSEDLVEKLKNVPIIHIAHHMGYQGWDYDNTEKLLNSLYEKNASVVFKNAKAVKNSNPRDMNSLIIYDCYNQASCSLHLADRVVTVSKNYMEEVSKERNFGYDFRDILKIRKDHRTFFGIVNGYDKLLISPNKRKIDTINEYFGDTEFKTFSVDDVSTKLENKKEFIKLISKIAKDQEYYKKIIPLIDIYKFKDISKVLSKADKTPIISATSRMVEQKGYDIAADAIMSLVKQYCDGRAIKDCPIFILGGAGDDGIFAELKKLKDEVTEINKEVGDKVFVFHGYRDEFAYAIQLASDFYMMPSRFEPCGLTQMEAMAKGTLPIAMSTGGLVDTIVDGVDGFRTEVFFVDDKRVYGSNIIAQRLKNNVNAYAETLIKALSVFYDNKSQIKQMVKNAMHKDFSWRVKGGSLEKYYQLFKTGHI